MTDRLRHLSRRSVNTFLAAAVAWPYDGWVQLTLNQPDQAKPMPHVLCRLFENPRSAYAIGTACLKLFPLHARSPQLLADAIFATAECDTEAMKTKEAIRHRIANRVHRDFAEGAVVNVEGWLLSQTEARLYALVALSLKSS